MHNNNHADTLDNHILRFQSKYVVLFKSLEAKFTLIPLSIGIVT